MADNLTPPGFTAKVATDAATYSGEEASVQLMRLVDVTGAEGSKSVVPHGLATEASVAALLTNEQLRAAPIGVTFTNSQIAVAQFGAWTVGVTGTVAVTGPLTDAQLRASPVGVTFTNSSLAVTQSGSWTVGVSGSVAVTGPLTDAQLRATALSVTFTNSSLAVTGPLTDAQLRATPVPISGTVTTGGLTDAQLRASALSVTFTNASLAVTGPLTNTELRAAAIATVENATVITGAAAQTAIVNNILDTTAGAAALDVSNFRTASVQVISTGTGGTFIFEQSNDNVNFRPLPVFNAELVTGVPITAAITASASQIIYTFPVRARFLRLRIVSAITGGSIQAFTRLSSDPWTAAAQLVASNTAGNLNATVAGTVGVTGYPTAAASADGLANPTVTKIDALGLQFNGTSWDRTRNNANIAIETSSAKTASGSGATQTNFNNRGVFVWINVTAVSGTTPTLTVRLQWSPDGGTTWVDLDTTNAQTVSITAPGQHVLRVYPGMATAANASLNSVLPRTWRLAWTIGGTTPSFTFAAQASYVN